MKTASNIQVSVVVPTYNGGKLFQEVLDSVLKQKNSFTVDIVVIDSSSTDGTAEYLKAMTEKHSSLHFVSIPKKEFQHGRTRNIAISKTKGSYVAVLTQDAMPTDESWLSNLIAPMLTDESVAGVFGKHLPYPEADIFEKNTLEKQFAQFGENTVLFRLENENRKRFEEDASYRGFLCFYSDNNSALRKSVWEKIPYPEVAFAEDQLWAREIIKSGYVKAYNSEAVVYHSHRFGFAEYLERSKEEGEALYSIHGWRICKSYSQLPRQILYLVKRDCLFLKSKKLSILDQMYWIKYSFMKNTAKAVGLYLGYKKQLKK